MNGYTVHLEMKSPLVTEFQSDTIFGHICWAVRYLQWPEGERLSDFLDAYRQGAVPPLLVSNGFPKGYLPKPVIPPVSQDELKEAIGNGDRVTQSQRIKRIKKLVLIPREIFDGLANEMITPKRLFKSLYDHYLDKTFDMPAQGSVVMHNSVNRATGRVDSGLYSQEETFFPDNGGEFVIYLKGDYFTKMELERIFGFIAMEGFGKDKSTGKGHFKFTIEPGIDLPQCDCPDSFMSLSSFIPTSSDPTDGHYTLLHKYGKLGGGFASGASGSDGNPFKKPLLMFAAGSTFRDLAFTPNKVYGSLLGDVHTNPAIKHYALAFPLGIKLETTNDTISS